MKVIKNQTIVQAQNDTIIRNELSSAAMVLQTPTIMVDYFSVDSDMTEVLPGTKNLEDVIGPTSTIVFNHIDNLPMSGVDNLVEQAQFDEDIGFDEDFQSAGVIYPNTIFPKPYDCFMIKGSKVNAIYIVTGITPTTVRSNPFYEIQFRLLSRDGQRIKQLWKQVHNEYVTTVTAIGTDKTLVISKSSYFKMQHHIKQYLEMADLYAHQFYDEHRAAFTFDGICNPEDNTRQAFIDLLLWKFMFEEGIVIYDNVITYASNNYQRTFDRIYTGCPDILLDSHAFHRSILWRIYDRAPKDRLAEYRFPVEYQPTERITKYQGKDLIYLEAYDKYPCDSLFANFYFVWDDEFIHRIVSNLPYDENPLDGNVECTGCYIGCDKSNTMIQNPFLRNVLIKWYNHTEDTINWDDLEIQDIPSVENYMLIPLVMAIYKQYIHDLQGPDEQLNIPSTKI